MQVGGGETGAQERERQTKASVTHQLRADKTQAARENQFLGVLLWEIIIC